ncbi:glycosyltransferase [Flavobacterium sp. U410]
MKLLVVSSAPIVLLEERQYMYGPYQKEMKIWARHVGHIQFCCPIWKDDRKLLVDEISFPVLRTIELKEFDIKSVTKIPQAFYYSLLNFWIIVRAMKTADHIHLRCPGNIGLLASIAQIFYPNKKKTTKYAGNWDPKAKQPWSYRMQRKILSNTFLTKNMQVLVYGEWPGQTKNIKSFFTATYSQSEIQNSKFSTQDSTFQEAIKFLFVGTLSPGKQPLYVIQLVEKLKEAGENVSLEMYGEGTLRKQLEEYIKRQHLKEYVQLKGNQPKEAVLQAYQKSDYLILPSKSEGWPKVVAEAMFWGCVPLATPVSCVSYMLGHGDRGIVLTEKLQQDAQTILDNLQNRELYQEMSQKAQTWSQQFTTDKFEEEIRKLLIPKAL